MGILPFKRVGKKEGGIKRNCQINFGFPKIGAQGKRTQPSSTFENNRVKIGKTKFKTPKN